MSFRITKSKDKRPAFLRSSSGSFSRASHNKILPRLKKAATQVHREDYEDDEKLDDLGVVPTLGASLGLNDDVAQTIAYIRGSMFDEIPTEKSGMNGARIADVLSFRKNLPPIVTNAHVHALIDSPTHVEKEIGQLVSTGALRRIIIPGRGIGASAISDALVTISEWRDKVNASLLPDEIKELYKQLLVSGTDSLEILSTDQVNLLVQAGFLTSASRFGMTTNTPKIDVKDFSRTALSVHNIARAASGSMDAVGGQGAIYRIGGGGVSGLNESSRSGGRSGDMKLSLPNVGSYLKLLQGAREHLLNLLTKSKYNEAPVYLIKERWDGGISTKNPYGRSKDPFKMILPGKTKKWKDFYGLRFDWVLAECLGSGLIELFNTRSVGLGMRLA